MCKYNQYKIQVVFLDGARETINFKGANTSSYKEMLQVYKTVKKDYQETTKTISFIGVSTDGEIGILFTKENQHNELKSIDKDTYDIALEIQSLLKTLQEKKSHHINMGQIMDKKQSDLLHKVETFKNKKFKDIYKRDNEKIKLFDELAECRDARRWHKDQKAYIYSLTKKMDLDKQLKAFELTKKKGASEYEYIEEESSTKAKIVQEIRYKDNMDRDYKVRVNKNKYDVVKIDERLKKIICYNNCK